MPLADGPRVQLQYDRSIHGSCSSFDISPDSQWVVSRDYFGVSSLPIAGGDPITLSDVSFYALIPGRPEILVGAEGNDQEKFHVLQRMPLGGGTPVILFTDPEKYINRVQVSPDGQRVVFTVEPIRAGYAELCEAYLSMEARPSIVGKQGPPTLRSARIAAASSMEAMVACGACRSTVVRLSRLGRPPFVRYQSRQPLSRLYAWR